METLKQQCIYCGDIIQAEDMDGLVSSVQEHYLTHTPINAQVLKELVE